MPLLVRPPHTEWIIAATAAAGQSCRPCARSHRLSTMMTVCGSMVMMKTARPHLDHDRIAAFCRRHRIRQLALFGSVLRDDFGPDSDVDVLVQFEPGAKTGLAFFGMQEELSDIIGRKVDLNTLGFLNPRIRSRVLREKQDVYVAA